MKVVDIMYSPDSFSPPPMEDMSPTTGNNDGFQLFEERIFPFVVFSPFKQYRLCISNIKIFFIVHLVSAQNLKFCETTSLFD